MLRVFRFGTFITTHLNFSVDTLQHARFCRERRQVRDSFSQDQVEIAKSQSTRENNSSLLTDINWLLRYNLNGIPYMLVIVLHIFIILFGLSLQLMYSFLPSRRDPITNEQSNSILRYLDSHHLANYIEPYPLFNKMFVLHLLQALIMRVQCLLMKLRNSRLNRYRYRKINLIEASVGYVTELASDLNSWTRLLLTFGRHECRLSTTLHRDRGKLMKKLSKQARRLGKMDRLYFFNQLEFNECFEQTNIRVNETSCRLDGERCKFEKETGGGCSWQDYLLHFDLPDRQLFVPKPGHRMDPVHVCLLLIFYIIGTFSDIFITLIALGSYIILGSGIEQSDWSIEKALNQEDLILNAILGILFILPTSLNAYDVSKVGLSSLLIHSRADKLIRMLETELKIHNFYIRSFWADVDRDTKHIRQDEANFAWFTELAKQTRGRADEFIQQYSDRSPDLGAHLRAAVHGFRQKGYTKRINELNENVSYLLDLVEILRDELNDSKSHITLYLDLNILFATVSSALSFTVVTLLATGTTEIVLALATFCANFLPMLMCLCLGATSERSFRQIYLNLMPFTINELGLIQLPIVRRLQRICEHLAKIENRSFVVLGSFPLTFSSVTGLLGWSSSGVLILHRFLA